RRRGLRRHARRDRPSRGDAPWHEGLDHRHARRAEGPRRRLRGERRRRRRRHLPRPPRALHRERRPGQGAAGGEEGQDDQGRGVITNSRRVPTYCYQCVAGPDLLTVKVADGVATEVEPNFAAAAVHPGGGKVCVKAYGLVQKAYHPDRVLRPMKRTNPKKGRDEDPGFVPISWDEALSLIAGKLNAIKEKGLL